MWGELLILSKEHRNIKQYFRFESLVFSGKREENYWS